MSHDIPKRELGGSQESLVSAKQSDVGGDVGGDHDTRQLACFFGEATGVVCKAQDVVQPTIQERERGVPRRDVHAETGAP